MVSVVESDRPSVPNLSRFQFLPIGSPTNDIHLERGFEVRSVQWTNLCDNNKRRRNLRERRHSSEQRDLEASSAFLEAKAVAG